jgi:hypothetical protein
MKLRKIRKQHLLKPALKLATATLGTLALAMAFASTAKAGCGPAIPGNTSLIPQQGGQFVQAAYSGAEFRRSAAREDDHNADPSIVGLWQFKVVALGNQAGPTDYSLLDDGLEVWHSDGTEIENSDVHPPITSNFCLGVYEKDGPLSYHLHHIALPWNAAGTAPAGSVDIKENVVLDPKGNFFSGSVVMDVYDPNGNHVGHVTGRVTATRITAD